MKELLLTDMKNAMKQRDTDLVSLVRMMLSEIKNKEIELRRELIESESIQVIRKMIKQRKESYEIFKTNNRLDLAKQELLELNLLTSYLPKQLSENELRKMVDNSIKVVDAKSIKDIGKVIKQFKTMGVDADMSIVNKMIKEILE